VSRDRPRPVADHFAPRAGAYAAHRPGYPDELFAFLAAQCRHHDLAWDCGTGSGQAALGLARHFRAVHATDPSAAQLSHAAHHPAITYHRTDEGGSGLPPASADLVTAAQALHWFHRDAFFGEARRVCRPGGIVAVWCYGLATITPDIDRAVRRFHDVTVGPDWPAGRELVVTLYRDIAFPFDEIGAPAFAIERDLDLAGFGQYLNTWSAVERHEARTGRDPVPALIEALRPAWGDTAWRRVRWPLGIRVGRVSDRALPLKQPDRASRRPN
jgi:SAM-dependent methyltransferase